MHMSIFNYSSSIFGGFSTNSMSSLLNLASEYSSIRSGSYKKLLKKYYGQYNADGTAKTDSATKTKDKTRTPKKAYSNITDSAKDLTTVSEKASSLQSAATKLAAVKSGSSSLYAKKAIVEKQADGTTTTKNDYDYKTLTSAAKSLVSAYNETLDAVGKVSSASVAQKTKWMTDLAGQYKTDLESIGITFDKDNRMQLDEAKFTASDMDSIQNVFEGSTSFAGKLARKASNLAGAAEVQANQVASAYGSNGTTYKPSSMNSGSIFDSLF